MALTKVNSTMLQMGNVSAKTTTYAVLASDGFLTGDSSGGTFDFDLPPAANVAGRIYTFLKISSDTTAIVIDPNGSETINGLASRTLTAQWDYIRIISNGTNWNVLDAKTTSEWRGHTAGGYGSTDNKIRIISTQVTNIGSGFTYATSAANGSTWTILEPGVWAFTYGDGSSGASGISLNSNQLTTNINAITDSDRLMRVNAGSGIGICQITKRFVANDVLRCHTDGGLTSTTDGATTNVTLTKVSE